MILIADSGSTKCDWILINRSGKRIQSHKTIGINPLTLSSNRIKEVIYQIPELLEKSSLVDEIHFYGAGCGTEQSNQKIKTSLSSIFENSKLIKVEEDIIAAVHASTNNPGVIGILGTGSNCCYFDGKKVIQKSPSLGYLLADEGSGNYFGKELLKNFYLKQMPSNLAKEFEGIFGSDLEQLFQKLYNTPQPNTYLASYAVFIFRHRGHPFIENMLYKGIKAFIDNYVILYSLELKNCPIHFVGSVAYYAQDIINKILGERGFIAKRFIKEPIGNLIDHVISTNYIFQKTI